MISTSEAAPERVDETTAAVIVRACGGVSAIHRARSAGPLRLLFPRSAGRAAWIVTSQLGGGLVDGDAAVLELAIGESAVALCTTQSSTKVYRGRSRQEMRAVVGEGGVALLLPDPIAVFRGADFVQRTSIDLGAGASALLVDVLTGGRIAHGERWASDRIDSTLVVSSEGCIALRDRILLDPSHGEVGERMGRFDAIGTVLFLGPAFEDEANSVLAEIGARSVGRRTELALAASSIESGVVVRIAATTIALAIETTRRLVENACARFGEQPFARKW